MLNVIKGVVGVIWGVMWVMGDFFTLRDIAKRHNASAFSVFLTIVSVSLVVSLMGVLDILGIVLVAPGMGETRTVLWLALILFIELIVCLLFVKKRKRRV
ncbi:MAG: hypothetical protein WCD70_10265 [Alphaproteobacteria bacterium]